MHYHMIDNSLLMNLQVYKIIGVDKTMVGNCLVYFYDEIKVKVELNWKGPVR